LSHSYDKENIVSDYYGVELYLHTFSATALDGDVLLNSTIQRSTDIFPQKVPPASTVYGALRDIYKWQFGQEKDFVNNYGH